MRDENTESSNAESEQIENKEEIDDAEQTDTETALVEAPMPVMSAVDIMRARISQLDALVPEQKEHVQNCRNAVRVKRKRFTTNRQKSTEIEMSLSHLAAARDSLGTWLQERSQSLAYRLLDHLDQQEALLRSDEIRIRQWAEKPPSNVVDTAAKLKRRFVISLWVSALFALLIAVGTSFLGRILGERNSELAILDGTWWRYAMLGIALLFVFLLVSLMAYFHGYNQMKVSMDRHLSEGRYLRSAINHIRGERARLDSLTPQVKDRLEFYGAVLQEPWRVPNYGSSVDDSTELKKGLPALLQIAKTSPAGDPRLVRLRNKCLAEQYQVGMRRNAIDELLKAAAIEQGIAVERAELSEIDQDSTSYGLRSALFTMIRDESVLEKIGQIKVERIAAQIQEGMGAESERPSISLTNVNVFHGLQVNHDLLSEWRSMEFPWDEYVSEILESGAALSRLAFSALGTTSAKYLHFESIAVAPERLKKPEMTYLKFVDIGNDTVTGTEIVSRIDITQPMDVDQVALFQNLLNDSFENEMAPRTTVIVEPDGTL